MQALAPWSEDILVMASRTNRCDQTVLREVLVRAACPVVCVGHRQDVGEDWHEWCERKADAALAILMNISPP